MESAEALDLKIEGMHCDACVRRVTNALGKLPGVAVKHVEVGSASLSYDPEQADPSSITDAVRSIGFNIAG